MDHLAVYIHGAHIDEVIEKKHKRKERVHKHKCIYAGHTFTYEDPTQWYLINKQANGKRQSPIALFNRKAQPDTVVDPLSFQYYDVPLVFPIEIHNNGNTVETPIHTTINGTHPAVTGGGVNDVYEAVNIHFHWGAKNTKGTEHAINGKKYDLEMHIVHRNVRFKNMKEALEDPYGFVVLAILLQKSDTPDKTSYGLNAIYRAMPHLTEYHSTCSFKHVLTMQSFIGDLNTDQFFTYRGSLTTPPCAEAVTWFVFTDIRPIHHESLSNFFNLFDERGLPLVPTMRPLQSSFLRRMYYRKGAETEEKSKSSEEIIH